MTIATPAKTKATIAKTAAKAAAKPAAKSKAGKAGKPPATLTLSSKNYSS